MSHTLEERCRQLMIQRKFEQCQKEIETAMAENPHCAIPHNLMGILLEKEFNHVLAMKHFRAAYALDPTYVPARYNMEQYGQMYPTGKCAFTEEDCPVKNTFSRKDWMNIIYVEYNIFHNSIDIYTYAGYILRIDCWEAEKNLKTTPSSECALSALAIDNPLEYARLYLDGAMQMWIDA